MYFNALLPAFESFFDARANNFNRARIELRTFELLIKIIGMGSREHFFEDIDSFPLVRC